MLVIGIEKKKHIETQIVRFMSFDNDSVINHAYYNFANQTVNTCTY